MLMVFFIKLILMNKKIKAKFMLGSFQKMNIYYEMDAIMQELVNKSIFTFESWVMYSVQ